MPRLLVPIPPGWTKTYAVEFLRGIAIHGVTHPYDVGALREWAQVIEHEAQQTPDLRAATGAREGVEDETPAD